MQNTMAEIKETLLIVLIHGFYGGEDTFGDLPRTLKENLGAMDLVIKHFVFKSQGDLGVAVAAFRKWHNEQVEAIEEMKDTDASTVKTILLSHSMGGIIAVDSLLSMIDDNDPAHTSILGIIAYDTPYFGLNPPVIHRTISTRVNTLSSAVNTARDWIPSSLYTPKSTTLVQNTAPPKSTWGLGKTIAASVAGVAAVGAISYFAKDPVVNHLQFVKVLYKPDELARRMKRLEQTRGGTGFACFYTVVVDKVEGGERTFCNLPVGGEREEGRWIRQENGVAKDEVEAHCGMFLRRENDHYEEMCRQSIRIIRDWIGARN